MLFDSGTPPPVNNDRSLIIEGACCKMLKQQSEACKKKSEACKKKNKFSQGSRDTVQSKLDVSLRKRCAFLHQARHFTLFRLFGRNRLWPLHYEKCFTSVKYPKVSRFHCGWFDDLTSWSCCINTIQGNNTMRTIVKNTWPDKGLLH